MRWLLRLLIDDAERRAIESDLTELYELRRRRDGAPAAGRWLRRQRFIYPWHLLIDSVRTGLPGRNTMHHLWHDIRYSLRSLARVPALAATIVLTVGLGLGATTAMVALIQVVLLNPLPYADPGSLVWIYTDNPPFRFRLSVVDYRALEADHAAFSAIAAYQTTQVTLSNAGVAERVVLKSVTGSYFPLLGQTPHIGRLFDPSDDKRNDRSVVLTYSYWVERFGADRSVLGRTITLDGNSYTIAGVLQRRVGPLENGVAMFTVANWPPPQRKGPFSTMVLARPRPDVPRAAALDALRATNARLFPIWRSSYQDEKATWGMLDLKDRVVGETGQTLVFVLAAVGCVLLIACANAVNLLIARGLHRSRELAIRGALGASRRQLLQHVIVEAAVLTAAAALVGAAIAAGSLQLVARYGVNYIPRLGEVQLSAGLLAWWAALSIFSGLLIGLVPALHGSRVQADRALSAGGRSSTDGPAARQVRRGLVAAEFALATPLLVAAALILASLDRLTRVPVGIETEHLLTAAVSLPGASYPKQEQRAAFWKRAVARLAAVPGVAAAGLADSRPPSESGNQNNFDLEDKPTPQGENQPICTWVAASPEFFATVGLRLERGRLLDEFSLRDRVIVVDRAWANRFFPGEEVLGRRLREGGCTTCDWITVVGLVSDVKWAGLEAEADGTVYWPFVDTSSAYLVLRTAGRPAGAAQSLRQAIRELDPGLALEDVATGDELVSQALVTPRYLSVLLGMFAATALVLSVVGIYGVMAYFVQQHTRDIGIRLALGGDPSGIRRMVVLQGLRLVAIGVVAGIVAAFYTGRLMTTVLFAVSPTDVSTMIGVPFVLLAVAVIACLLPARRAARVDPAVILRES